MKPRNSSSYAVFVFLCSLCFGTFVAEQGSATQQPDLQKEISAEVVVKTTHKFLLYLPDDYEEQESHALLLFLHGAGERGDGELEKVKIHGPPKQIKNGKKFPCIVVSPQCKYGSWWEPWQLSALLDHVEANYKVDKDRVYVTGLSMGGYGTWNLAVREPNRFAAIAPICGGGDARVAKYTPAFKVPTWAFHGAKDAVIPLSESQEMVDVLKSRNVEVKMTVYPEVGHNAWEKAYHGDELYDWLFAHKRQSNEEN